MTAWTNVNTITNTLEPVVSGLYNLSSNTYKWGDFYNLTTVSNTITATGSLIIEPAATMYANGTTGTAGQVLLTNGSTVYWGVANQSVTFVANSGLVSNSTGIHVLANNGIVANITGVYAYTNTGLVSNSTGIHVLPNSGIVVSSTGVSVNSAYIGTLSANNTTYLNSEPASYYTNATNLSTGTVPTARLASGTANSTTYLRGDQTWATVAAGGSGTVTSVATGTGLTGGPITTTGTISLATLSPAPTGTYSSGISSVTVDAYGRVTSVSGGAGYVTSSGVTSITAGAGLSGGTITSTGTISLTSGVITPQTYGGSGISSVTVDTYGRVTGVGTSSYAPLASPTFTGTVTLPSTSAFNSTGLGVGTTSPTRKLDVRGTVYFANQVSVGTTFDYGRITIIGGTTYTSAVAYGYLTSSGTGVYSGGSQSLTVSLYAGERILALEVDAFSDRRLKNNIINIEEDKALSFINTVNGVNFNWNNTENSKSRTGFIAQDIVKAGFDNLVSLTPHSNMEEVIDDDGFVSPAKHMFTVNYDQVVPYLSTALKHSLKRIESLEALVGQLEARVAALESR